MSATLAKQALIQVVDLIKHTSLFFSKFNFSLIAVRIFQRLVIPWFVVECHNTVDSGHFQRGVSTAFRWIAMNCVVDILKIDRNYMSYMHLVC